MHIKLSFLGAARNVAVSRYLLEVNNTRLLVDCGLYQEREYRSRNLDPFPTSPHTIDAVLLTHAHLDHCGLLPKLVRDGFQGKIYCTAATSDIAEIMLLDAAKLQEEDAACKKRRHEREGRKGPFPEVPLYTVDDAKAALPLFSPVRYGEAIKIGDDIKATFYNAGHVLGASMIMVSKTQAEDRSPFDLPSLKMNRTADESKTINYIWGNAMIVAGSGICTGGRTKHHLVTNISRPEYNTIHWISGGRYPWSADC